MRFFIRLAGLIVLMVGGMTVAHAQVATVPSSDKEINTVTIAGDIAASNTYQTAYTVPSNLRFRLTDIIITNYNNGICDLFFYVGANPTREIRTQPNAMTALSLLSGPTAGPGQTVLITTDQRLPGATDCTPTFTLMGYLFKPVPGP